MKIYTKTGDEGFTSLVGGTRIDKSHVRIEAYGTVDELNSSLGYLLALCPDGAHAPQIEAIQQQLFNIGCHLATDIAQGNGTDAPCLDPSCIVQLETAIDQMQEKLPPQTHFILPGGTPTAAWAHVCRTICRRAERRVVTLSHEAHVSFSALQYLNRLSDYLFVLARFINHNADLSEKTWQNTCK
mgnify:FL=1